jgi:hypothetical protein
VPELTPAQRLERRRKTLFWLSCSVIFTGLVIMCAPRSWAGWLGVVFAWQGFFALIVTRRLLDGIRLGLEEDD